jgi:hypothetical protein
LASGVLGYAANAEEALKIASSSPNRRNLQPSAMKYCNIARGWCLS